MTVSVKRRGDGPALFQTRAAPEKRSSGGGKAIWVVFAVILAVFLAMPAFAQAAPAGS